MAVRKEAVAVAKKWAVKVEAATVAGGKGSDSGIKGRGSSIEKMGGSCGGGRGQQQLW